MKKLISFILTVTLVLAHISAFAYDAYSVNDEEDRIELLSELGIFTSSDFSAGGEHLTRAEAARLLVKMAGAQVSSSTALPFADVESGDENYAYIAAAYAMKYISGVSDSQFAPDALVTKSQVAKIIMSILGYDAPCMAAGGYPAGYLRYAGEVDLFEGVSFETGEHVTPAEMSNIIFNALGAALMIQSSFGDEIGYTSYDNKNLLSENFDIYVETAVIEADRYTGLYDKNGTGADEIIAGSVVYDASQCTASIPVGMRCNIYYRQASSGAKRILLFADAQSEYNNVYKIESDNVVSASQSQLEYIGEADKQKRINIAANAAFLFNGQLVSSVADIFEDYDEILAIDNDKNNSADVIFVKKYTVVQVKSLSKDSFTVYDKISRQSYCLDNSGNMHTVFYYDGKVTDFFEIEKDTVLSMLIPLDTSGEYTQTVYVSDIYEDVVLDEIDISGGKVVAGVNSYKAVSTCLAELKSGQKYRFFFDEMGRIAAAQSVDSIKYYGFFNAVKKSVFDGVTVSLFATDGTWLEAKLANNISCNGSKIAAADIYSNGELFPSGQLKPQLVEYKINADGKIISIATPTDVTSIRFTNEEYDIIERDEFRLSFMSGSARFFNSTGTITFGEKAHLAADATIMIIPTDTSAKNEFLIATPDKLTHNISYTGIKLYNCDEYACSGLAIVADNTASYRGTTPMVVSNVKTVLNEDGDTVERVYGYSRTTYETENDVAEYTSLGAITGAEAQLKAGDVIIPVINADGKLVNFERTHNAGVSTYGASSTTIYSDYVTVYGKVIDSSADYVVLDYSADKASFRLYSTSVYVCEPSRDGGYTVRLGSVSDLNVGDDVVIRSYYLRGTVAVVYKK